MIMSNIAGAQLTKNNRVVSFTWNPDEKPNIHVAIGDKKGDWNVKAYIYSVRKAREFWKQLRAEGYEQKRVW